MKGKKTDRAACILIATAAVLMAAAVCGCGARGALNSGKRTEREYGKGETMVILTSERLRYEKLYTEKIWDTVVDNRGTTFDTALTGQVHDFLRELKVMALMAADMEVELTNREKDLVKEATSLYYRLTGGTLAARLGISESDLERFYTDYWMANKLVGQLTQGKDLEISDSEAKVITVQQIELDDEETAKRVLARALDEGSDFYALAKENSIVKEIRRQIYHGLCGKEYEEAAFALRNGEISGIIHDNGMFYIIKCVDDYDEEATALHKEQMALQKKNEAFFSVYQEYKDGIELVEDSDLWKGLTVRQSPEVQGDFFGIFAQVCEER